MPRISFIILAALLPIAVACTPHSKAWDDAWAQCQGEAQEAMETAEPDRDQVPEFLQNYSNQCMEKKGFRVSSSI